MEKTHLGWERMPLELAAEWLRQRFDGQLDGVLVALPGARAGRILSELLARRARDAGAMLRPPTIVTAGLLSDELLEVDGAPAGRLVRTLAWERALRSLPESSLHRIVARAPGESDLAGWTRLAEEVRGLFGEVAAEGLDFAAVVDAEQLREQVGERARWAALAEAQAGMKQVLAEAGMVDPHLGRLKAIEERQAKPVREIVLIGVVEMNALLRQALELCEAPGTALVFAPEELRDAFDGFGCLKPEVWLTRETSLGTDRWQVVDRPDDQARRAIEVLAGWRGEYAAEQITIGLADLEVSPFLRGRLAEHGIVARDAAGTPFPRTAPAMLLQAVGDFLDGRRFPDFAALLRHPDFDRALRERDATVEPAGLVDEYHGEHLPGVLDGKWLAEQGKKRDVALRGRMEALWAAVRELFGELLNPAGNTLTESIPQLRALFERVYGGRDLEPAREEDRLAIAALRLIGHGLAEIEALPAALVPGGKSADAIDMVLRASRAETVPPPAPREDEPTIELLGWLELALDDAPALVVTGFEDGKVPESKRADAYLPNRLRQDLGLVDDSRRLARDLYATELLVHSRSQVAFLSGRRSLAGEPQVPSRIVFHCEPDELLPRVKRFLEGDSGASSRIVAGSDSARELPRGTAREAPESMGVTDFGMYLRSPYEYYLRRIVGLDSLDDDDRELSASSFGNLAHKVLQRFGENRRARDEHDPEKIERFLAGEMRSLAIEIYGADPLPAVRLQLEQLGYRLSHFARRQAERRQAGWEIHEVEWSPSAGHYELIVDDEPMKVRGRIDRIDRHPKLGWAIWDYKTGDVATKPENEHRTADGNWRDLQLPLYCLLVMELLEEPPAELGYISLCREPGRIGFYPTPPGWRKKEFDSFEEGIADAFEAAQEIVRQVRRGEFFIDEDFKPYGEILGAIGGVGLIPVVESDEGAENEEAAQ